MLHPEHHLILNWDTFQGARNGAEVYFNWVGNLESFYAGYGGGWVSDVDVNGNQLELPIQKPDWEKSTSFESYLAYMEPYEAEVKQYREANGHLEMCVGYLDARQALGSFISRFSKVGKFIKWTRKPLCFRLSNHADFDEGRDLDKVTEGIVGTFPEEIQSWINSPVR